MAKKSVGLQLKEQRESQHLTLEDIEKTTGINRSYLFAIESDQFSLIPAKSLQISYIKQYAQILNLDEASILNDYHIAVADRQENLENKKKAKKQKKTVNSYSRVRTFASHDRKNHHRKPSLLTKIIPYLIIAVLFLFIIFICFIVWQKYDNTQNDKRLLSTHVSSSNKSKSSSLSVDSTQLLITPSADAINLSVSLKNATKPINIVLTQTSGSAENWFYVSNSKYESGGILNQNTKSVKVDLAKKAATSTITISNTSQITISINNHLVDLSSLNPGSQAYITLTIE